MRHFNQGRFRQQVQFLRRQFLQDGDLPFAGVLSEDLVTRTLTAVGVVWKDRIYSPLVTLWVFLSQVLSADHSCRAAVARLIACIQTVTALPTCRKNRRRGAVPNASTPVCVPAWIVTLKKPWPTGSSVHWPSAAYRAKVPRSQNHVRSPVLFGGHHHAYAIYSGRWNRACGWCARLAGNVRPDSLSSSRRREGRCRVGQEGYADCQ
jgi:hypothetical protein